jgi:AraC-like DNA-binding protein
VNSGQEAIFRFSHQVFTPLYFAVPACFYLYITGFINARKKLSRLEWLHFTPVLLAIIHVFPWHPPLNWDIIVTQVSENRQLFITEKSGLFPAYFYYLGKSALVLGYLLAAWIAVLSSKTLAQKNAGDMGKKWIYFCLIAATFFQLISFLPLLLENLNIPFSNPFVLLLSCLLFLTLLIIILHQPKVFYGYLFVAVNWDGAKKEATLAVLPPPLSKRVNLLPDQLASYVYAMEEFMESKKPFLYPDFQIVDLARELNLPVHHCSYVVNHAIGKNFRDWINGYRVRCFIIEYPIKADKMTIEAIASESGFKTLTTFYNAFKKETGCMPTAYFAQKKVS